MIIFTTSCFRASSIDAKSLLFFFIKMCGSWKMYCVASRTFFFRVIGKVFSSSSHSCSQLYFVVCHKIKMIKKHRGKISSELILRVWVCVVWMSACLFITMSKKRPVSGREHLAWKLFYFLMFSTPFLSSSSHIERFSVNGCVYFPHGCVCSILLQ